MVLVCFPTRRQLHMPRGEVLPATGYRVLPDPGVRAVRADRDPVVGVLLDQHGVVTGEGLYRPADRADHVDHERQCQGHAATSLLHQGTTLIPAHF